MASEQVRKDNVTNLREIRAEGEEKVPKMADRRHGTSAEKIHGGSFAADVHGLQAGAIRFTGGTNNTSTQRRSQGQQPGREREERWEGKGEQKNSDQERKEENWPSLEESGLHRATAKQNTTEALRAAEERYEKAKERERQALDEAAEKARKAIETCSQYAARIRAEANREKQAKKATETEDTFVIRQDKLDDRNASGEGPRGIHAGVKPEGGRGGAAGVLGAIGETIVEIGQTAQDLVGGRGRSK